MRIDVETSMNIVPRRPSLQGELLRRSDCVTFRIRTGVAYTRSIPGRGYESGSRYEEVCLILSTDEDRAFEGVC